MTLKHPTQHALRKSMLTVLASHHTTEICYLTVRVQMEFWLAQGQTKQLGWLARPPQPRARQMELESPPGRGSLERREGPD